MSRASAAPRRIGLSPTGTIPDSAAATSSEEKNGVLPSSTPTCGGRSGSSRARSAAASRPRRAMWSRQLTNGRPRQYTPRSSTSTSGASRSVTVGFTERSPVVGVRPGCRPVRGRCAAAARWRRPPRTRSAWRPGSSGAPGGRCRCRRRRARAPWCARRGGRPRPPRTRRCRRRRRRAGPRDSRHAAWVSVSRRPLTSM